MKNIILILIGMVFIAAGCGTVEAQSKIIHDAEYYILEAQHGDKWAVEDKALDKKLAALEKKFGRKPNIIHFMWDDQPFGAVGIPALQKLRGYETPVINKMAAEGMLFTRMYTEPSCTPSRSAFWTGQHPIRNGVYRVGFPIEYMGMAKTVAAGTAKTFSLLMYFSKKPSGIYPCMKAPIPIPIST